MLRTTLPFHMHRRSEMVGVPHRFTKKSNTLRRCGEAYRRKRGLGFRCIPWNGDASEPPLVHKKGALRTEEVQHHRGYKGALYPMTIRSSTVCHALHLRCTARMGSLFLFYNSRWLSKKYREKYNAQSTYQQRCVNQSFHNIFY